MAENSGIEWTHHTFNPWSGCTKVSPACDNCYAEGWAKRSGHVQWGARSDRRRTKTWGNPVKWNRQAESEGVRYRVFCASLADVFDNHKSIKDEWRKDLWKLIEETPCLDWLLLTKRPQNIARFAPKQWISNGFPANIWLGTTVENQEEADRRIPHLIQYPARVRFLSCEPILGPVFMAGHWLKNLHWVIVGGESGANYRPADASWFRLLRDQCEAADVPFLFKQWEGRTQSIIKAKGRELDGVVHNGYPT